MVRLLIPKLMDMGLDIVDVQPYFISAKSKEKEYKFTLMVKDYYREESDYYIDLNDTDADYIVLVIRNKPNDNVVLLDSKDFDETKVSLSKVAKSIKKKWRWEINKISTT